MGGPGPVDNEREVEGTNFFNMGEKSYLWCPKRMPELEYSEY